MSFKFKDIVGYEDFYQVTDDGRVWSKRRNRWLKGSWTHEGYYQVVASVSGYKESLMVHRCVAEAFVRNSKRLPWVNHKNGIKSDNTAKNLEWCSPAGNRRHALETGLSIPPSGEGHYNCILRDEVIESVIVRYDAGESQSSIAKSLGVCQPHISRICSRKTRNTKTNQPN